MTEGSIYVQDFEDDYEDEDEKEESNILNISVASAVLFVLFASGFLFIIYKFMSGWFVLLLVILFCIGGAEVCSHFMNGVRGGPTGFLQVNIYN